MKTEVVAPTRFSLLTNIDGIRYKDIWIQNVAAILFVEHPVWANGKPLKGLDRRMRVFGPDSAWPVFTESLDSFEYQVEKKEEAHRAPVNLLTATGVSFSSGSQETFKISIEIFPGDIKKDLDVYNFSKVCREYEASENGYWQNLWAELNARTGRYTTTPYVPTLTWVDAKTRRALRA